MKAIPLKKRRQVYLKMAKDFATQETAHAGMCYYLLDELKDFNTTLGAWGIRVCMEFPEMFLFSSNEHGDENMEYFRMPYGDFEANELRATIALFAYHMAE
jgi:hypothetical protein